MRWRAPTTPISNRPTRSSAASRCSSSAAITTATTSRRRRSPPSTPGSASPGCPAIAERAEELRRLVAFRVTKVEIQAEAEWGARLPALQRADRHKRRYLLRRLCAQPAAARRHRHRPRRHDVSRRHEARRASTTSKSSPGSRPRPARKRLRDTFTTRDRRSRPQAAIRFSGTGYVLPSRAASGCRSPRSMSTRSNCGCCGSTSATSSRASMPSG